MQIRTYKKFGDKILKNSYIPVEYNEKIKNDILPYNQIVERCLNLYLTDEEFRKKVVNHTKILI